MRVVIKDSPRLSGRAGLALCIVLFTLWDYYFGRYGEGLRLLDLLGVALIAMIIFVALCLNGRSLLAVIQRSGQEWWLVIVLMLLFVVSGTIGSLREPANFIRPTAGVWLGLFVLITFYFLPLSRRFVYRVISFLIVIHSTALVVQLITFHTTGYLINYQQLVGAEPRVFSSIFRPSGLFLEPSAYSSTMMMLITLRLAIRPTIDALTAVALSTTIMTVSLFGFVAVCAVVTFVCWRRVSFWCITLGLAAAVIYALAALQTVPEVAFITRRIFNMSTDGSLLARYGGLIGVILGEHGEAQSLLWFGAGLGHDRQLFGSSGFGFLIASIGVIGTVVFVTSFVAIAKNGLRLRVLFSLCLLMVAAPLWTIMWWWAWLGLLLNVSSRRSAGGTRSPDSMTDQMSYCVRS